MGNLLLQKKTRVKKTDILGKCPLMPSHERMDHSVVPRLGRSVSSGSGNGAALETVKERTISGFPVT